MSLISVRGVSFCLSSHKLFEDLTFAINPGERIALAGGNGVGKSTLLKLLAGELEPDAGVIAKRSGAGVEYVPQTLLDRLAVSTLFNCVAEPLCALWDGYVPDYLVAERLMAAGFSEAQHHHPMSSMSGGEVNRALFARALAAEPDLILLDEPTNHMDVEEICKFEQFVTGSLSAALLIVSHDRELLDAVTTKTLILRDRKIYQFAEPFGRAREALALADAAAASARSDEERELGRLHTSSARLAEWGRMYGNEKFSQRAKSMQKRIEKLEEEKTFVSQLQRARVALATDVSDGATLLDLNDLRVDAPDGRHLFSLASARVQAGERIAFLGRNGCGKSTLLRLLVTAWHSGGAACGIRFHPKVRLGYYDQKLAHFKDGERIVEAVVKRCEHSRQRVTAELVSAGFAFERHNHLVSRLSGGEQARLTFVAMHLAQPNFLVLDEPTNHLDVEGIEQLEYQLNDGEGGCVFVSHDRRFVERVATKIIEVS